MKISIQLWEFYQSSYQQSFRKMLRQPTKRLLQQLSHSALTKVSGGKDNALLWSYSQFKLTPFLIVQGYCQGMYALPNMTHDRSY